MQNLPGGGHVVGWGGEGTVTEYDAAKNPVFDATIAGGSYRQYKFAWTGSPTEPPAVNARSVAGQMSVAMSWNGDTRTKQWRISTGPTSRSLAVVATVARTGFESTASVPQDAYLAVEALDGSGNVIGRSTTATVGSWFREAPSKSVSGSYQPLVGDFAGSNNDDVIYYSPGTKSDYLHISRADGTFDDVRLPAINGTYKPLVGDFVGDDRDEVLFTAPGRTTAYLWRFDRNGRSGAVAVDSASLSVPGTVTKAFVLDNRSFYGGPSDEVVWYAAGRAADRIDHFGWPSGGGITVTSRPISVSGTYQPVVGDFDGNGFADIFWYAPGSAPDSIWLLDGTVIRSQTQRTLNAPVSGTYQVLSGNFSGSATRSELAFYQPGGGPDFLWTFDGGGSPTSEPRVNSLTGTAYVLRGGVDRVMTWAPGSSPAIWSVDAGTTRPSGNSSLGSSYQPLIGDFTGPGGSSSVLWYAPGSAPERLYDGG